MKVIFSERGEFVLMETAGDREVAVVAAKADGLERSLAGGAADGSVRLHVGEYTAS
jgi:hypothetical protein